MHACIRFITMTAVPLVFQESVARALCQSAIKSNCYCDLSKESLFRVALPVGLVRMELHLLLEDHLRKIADGVAANRLQPLVVQFSSGESWGEAQASPGA